MGQSKAPVSVVLLLLQDGSCVVNLLKNRLRGNFNLRPIWRRQFASRRKSAFRFAFYPSCMAKADWQSLTDFLHDAVAQCISPHFMVTFSDYGNVLGQVHTIYGLVAIGEDQAVPRLGVPVFTHGP
jgi:hypothetical protein